MSPFMIQQHLSDGIHGIHYSSKNTIGIGAHVERGSWRNPTVVVVLVSNASRVKVSQPRTGRQNLHSAI